jgi:poly(beta-D-mannuronate) lyase
VFTSKSSVRLEGKHLVLSGLHFKVTGGDGNPVAIAVPGSHCRVTECAVEDSTTKNYVHLAGPHNRLDHCYLAGKTSDSPTVQVEAPAGPPGRSRIDRNHFGPRPPLGRNGGETIRVGYSHQQTNEAGLLCEFNLFDRCDGELEIISSKSCGNVYRANTFLDSAGTLTLRHGDRNVVDGNVFLGHGKKGTGGIRVLGVGHVVVNNYIENVQSGAFWLTAGVINPEPKEHAQARDCLIAFNTVVDVPAPAVNLSAGFKEPRRVLRPEGMRVVNNVFRVGEDGSLFDGKEGEGCHWAGNLAAGPGASGDGSAKGRVKLVDHLKLVREESGTGFWRPAPGSAAIDAADSDAVTPRVKSDIDGQARPGGAGTADSGCDEVSTEPVTQRTPLGANDVGPPWLSRTAGE